MARVTRSGTVTFKATSNKIFDPNLDPIPNTADVAAKIDLKGIENANGLVTGMGRLVPVRRTTFEDRVHGDMTVVDLNIPGFPVNVVDGRARIRTSANAELNAFGLRGAPGCTSLELENLELLDENGTPFARPGLFLPDINPN
jgi:hypothetical protein